jgi:hypothetical protein
MAFRTIGSAVGRQPALNAAKDQDAVRLLLNEIPEWVGGAEGSLQTPAIPGRISEELQDAIDCFQDFQVSPNSRDGRVDPNGETMEKLNSLANRTWLPEYTVPFVPLYGQKDMGLPPAAAENACWWACIRMVRETAKLPKVPPPQELTQSTKALNDIKILGILPRYQMYPAYSYKKDWTASQLIKALRESGPLCAHGRFAADDHETGDFGLQHAIVVFGLNRGMVHFNDPWEPSTRLMFLSDFNAKLHSGYIAIIAAWANTISRMAAVK